MRVRGRLAGAALTAAAISGGVAGLSANSASASGQNARQSVIVVLNNQDVAQPATPGDLPARSRSFQVTQAPILSSMHSTGATKIQTYSVLDAVAATVTPAEASALAANPAVSAIYPDGVVQIGSPNPGGDSASAGGGSDLASMARRAGAPRSDVAPGGGGSTGGGTAGVCSSTPDLAPAGLPLIHAASSDPAAKTAASLGFTGAGVTVGFIADGLNINNPDFIRPSGQHVFVDYKDFTGEGTKAPTDGGEAFGDASSIGAQGDVVYNVAGFGADQTSSTCNIRIQGVAPGASLVGLDVFGGGDDATDSTILNAINYAVTVDHVNVLNESFGGNPYPDDASNLDVIKLANDSAVNAGVTVTASTGDAGQTSTIGSPSTDPEVISAGASTSYRTLLQSGFGGSMFPGITGYEDNNISAFSSGGFEQSGRLTDVVAPGEDGFAACTAKPKRYGGCTNLLGQPSDVEEFGGTSEAAPLTAGVVALVDQAYMKTHGSYPLPAVVKQIITSTAQDIDAPADLQGAGLVNAYHAALAAESYNGQGSSPKPVGATILKSAPQLDAVAQPSTAQTLTDTLTNDGPSPEQLSLSSRTLGAWQTVDSTNVTLSDSSPVLPYWNGADAAYEPVTFAVPAGQARLRAAVAYQGDPAKSYSAVRITLVDPAGRLAAYTEPQGIGDYGQVEVTDPQAGTWTAYVWTRAASEGGIQGTSPFTASVASWQSLGAVSPSTLTLAPGQSAPVTLTTSTPATPGDEAGSINVQSQGTGLGARSTIPVSLRSVIPSGSESFTQTLTGGNGRATSTGQTFYYQMNVAAGAPELNAAIQLADDPDNPVTAYLVDPSGNAEAADSNAITNGTTGVTDELGTQLHVLDPAQGAWTLIVVFAPTISGTATSQQFTVATSEKAVAASVSAGALPDSASATLTAGKPTTVDVQVTNPGASPAQFFIDPRLAQSTTVPLAALVSAETTLPNAGENNIPAYLVPTDTTNLSATATTTGAIPIEIDMESLFGDPAVESPTSGSSVTDTYAADPVAQGVWEVDPQLTGAFGSRPAAPETATTTLSATTRGFDPTVSTSTGDLFADALTGQTANFAPVVIGPGQSAEIPVTITPKGASGKLVQGTLYLDTYTGEQFNSLTEAAGGTTVPTPSGDQMVAIPYEYTIN